MAAPGNQRVSTAILGQPKDPFAIIMNRKALADHQAQQRAAAEAKAKQERDKKFSEYMNYDPEKAWEPFNQQVVTAVNKDLREWVRGQMNSGADPNSADFMAEYKKRQDSVNSIARKSQHVKEVASTTRDAYKENEFFDTAYYDSKLQDIYTNPDGSVKPVSEIDTKAFTELLNDTGGYNVEKIVADFIKDLPEKVQKTYKLKMNGEMRYFDTMEYTTKLYGENPQFDKNGNPILQTIDQGVVVTAMEDPLLRKVVQARMAQNPGADERQILSEILGGRDNTKIERGVTGVGNRPSYLFEEGKKQQEKEKAAVMRDQTIQTIQKAFYDEEGNVTNTPNQEALTALGLLNGNVTIGGKKAAKAELKKADYTETWDENTKQNTSRGVKYDRIEFKDENGAKIGEVNLTDPGAYWQLDGILNTSTAENLKVGQEDLTRLNEKKTQAVRQKLPTASQYFEIDDATAKEMSKYDDQKLIEAIVGKVEDKETARKIYQEIKSYGR